MCVLSIKVPLRKKSGNLFNDPCILDFEFYVFITLLNGISSKSNLLSGSISCKKIKTNEMYKETYAEFFFATNDKHVQSDNRLKRVITP